MNDPASRAVGFTCAYTPLALIDAAGLVPWRILPLGDSPDQSGAILHDNMCPHVKRVLDRALASDLPELAGVVLMNSCDAMRRLADGWPMARPGDRLVFLDLPVVSNELAIRAFARELRRLGGELAEWTGSPIDGAVLARAMELRNELAIILARLGDRAARGALDGGRPGVQELLNRSVSVPIGEALDEARRLEASPEPEGPVAGGVPVLVFGNVLPDPEAHRMLEGCGCLVVDDDTCTGSRQQVPIPVVEDEDPYLTLARGGLGRPLCSRTLGTGPPGALAAQILERVQRSGARGVIGHFVKFCDPYLSRVPMVRQALKEVGVPLLVLEGDCTLRSLGQHRTRIEAFAEMLGDDGRPSS